MTSPSDAAARPESQSPPPAQTPPGKRPEDELPEWEPLTPELVEDEAIRGDAMLRNAVLLLAVLLGWTQISDSSLLVRIKSGQFMAEHGFLPPRTDPFSVSAEGRNWINLGWVGDLALAGAYRAGALLGDAMFADATLLTLWGVIASLFTFLLVSQISIPRIPTWWSSIVAALALVAAFPALTAGPASITLVGLALMMWIVFQAARNDRAPSPAPLAILFLFWSNLDPAAWVGLTILWAAALGRFLTNGERWHAKAGTHASWLKTAAIATVAALVNPFHWHVLEAPFVLFGTELPEARAYRLVGPHFHWMLFSINEPDYWVPLDWPVIAGSVLAIVTLISLILNSSRTSLAHVAMFVVANALAFRAGLLLPAASIVNAVIAGLNGQAWYARTFRQTYSVAWAELLYSRLGRAVTVLGLFGLAYLMINGALPGVDGRRLGMGFDWRLKTATDSYATLASKTDDPRAFNGRPDHGDLMIWCGLRPFNDSRLALFARGGEDLLELHRATFRAMQVAQDNAPGTGLPEVWKATLDRFQLKHVYARLTGDDLVAKYSLLQRFLLDPELTLAVVDAAAARLDRAESATAVTPRLTNDPIRETFRGPGTPVVEPAAWPRELTTYERWLIQPEPMIPGAGQISQHLNYLADEIATRWPPATKAGETSHALRIQAIQNAWKSLSTDANTSQVHRVLNRVYQQILAGEQGFGQFGSLNELRVRQFLAASYFSVLTTAAAPRDYEHLAYTLVSVGYRDVALEQLQMVYKRTGVWTSLRPTDPGFSESRNENQALMKRLEQAVKEVQTNANREIQRGEDPIAVAKAVFDAGCPRFALTILEPLETQIVRDPMAAILHAQVLMAVGRIEESWERLDGIESLFPPDSANAPGAGDLKSIWRSNTAIVNMLRGDVDRAVTLWQEEAKSLESSSIRAALDNVPLSTTVPARQDLFAYVGTRVGTEAMFTFPERWASVQMLIAVSELEHGRLDNARRAVKLVLDKTPRASIRPLAAYYHSILTGETVSFQPPAADEAPANEFFDDRGAKVDPAATPTTDDAPPPPPPPVAVPLTPAKAGERGK